MRGTTIVFTQLSGEKRGRNTLKTIKERLKEYKSANVKQTCRGVNGYDKFNNIE